VSSFVSIISGIQMAQSIIRELVIISQQAQAEGSLSDEEIALIKSKAEARAEISDAEWDAAVAAAKRRLGNGS
jgi:hypothetical protein